MNKFINKSINRFYSIKCPYYDHTFYFAHIGKLYDVNDLKHFKLDC